MSAHRPISQRRVAPDPSITSAIGRHHSLPTAVADLVDNSIDAGAREVLIRFITGEGRATGLQVVDDGRGMDTAGIDAAMEYSRKRDYEDSALGHFGIGLKAASLSQAETLLVWSRRFGAPPVGRRLRRATLDTGPIVESFSTEDARTRLEGLDGLLVAETGTIVEWEGIRSFLHSDDQTAQATWLDEAIQRLIEHLGLVLHRILARGDVKVTVEVMEGADVGAPRTVQPLDPFGYARSGAPGFPADLLVELPSDTITARAHVWPSTSRTDPGFILRADGPLETQGLYVYRHDRLLQAGGWCSIARQSPELSYARLAVDITESAEGHVTINPEKTGVVLDATFTDALVAAHTVDGRGLRDFLDAAEGRAREARSRSARPVTVLEPRGGLPGGVLNAFEEEAGFDPDEEAVDIRWMTLPTDQFFCVDREERRLCLNLRYREAVVGHRSLDPGDAPLVKSLLYLLLNSHFAGAARGVREKRLERTWQPILIAAARAQAGTDDHEGRKP